MKNSDLPSTPPRKPFDFNIDEMLHPAQAFAHPRDVANDPDLTINEKRAILASWASDACAVETAPALRRPPGGGVVAVDEIREALLTLDREAQQENPQVAWARRQVRRQSIGNFRLRRRPGSGGDLPH